MQQRVGQLHATDTKKPTNGGLFIHYDQGSMIQAICLVSSNRVTPVLSAQCVGHANPLWQHANRRAMRAWAKVNYLLHKSTKPFSTDFANGRLELIACFPPTLARLATHA